MVFPSECRTSGKQKSPAASKVKTSVTGLTTSQVMKRTIRRTRTSLRTRLSTRVHQRQRKKTAGVISKQRAWRERKTRGERGGGGHRVRQESNVSSRNLLEELHCKDKWREVGAGITNTV
ncbi:uncharacterized protein LOC123503863 isoform X4 [Portunus trituberculatus]|uniref:uncharacterized protein LOC123503863 isoform X4 n=1 Tax=Portunus trituberculatus TaxID=210409 RepID=UPI001E1CF151|nr:uncharacterized protein LOC123503863 isoform X4 [Portunus trituberculatus]